MKKAQLDKKIKPVIYRNPDTTSELAFPKRFNFEVQRVDSPVTHNEVVAGFKEEVLRGVPPTIDSSKLKYGIAQVLKPLAAKRQEAEQFIKDSVSKAETELKTKAEAKAKKEAEAKKDIPAPAPAPAPAVNENIGGNENVK